MVIPSRCCCRKPCNICSNNTVAAALDLEMLNWADIVRSIEDVCVGGPPFAHDHVTTPAASLNTPVRMNFVRSLSTPGNPGCCALYYGERSFGDVLWSNVSDCLTTSTPVWDRELNWSRGNMIGFLGSIAAGPYPGSVTVALGTITAPPEAVSLSAPCTPTHYTEFLLSVVDREFFCAGGTSEELLGGGLLGFNSGICVYTNVGASNGASSTFTGNIFQGWPPLSGEYATSIKLTTVGGRMSL